MTEKLDLLLSEYRLNRKQFSERSGIPYMTVTNFYEKGTENVKLSTLKKISAFFEVSLDYIANDNITDKSNIPDTEKVPLSEGGDISDEDMIVARAYSKANDKDKNTVRAALDLPPLGARMPAYIPDMANIQKEAEKMAGHLTKNLTTPTKK